MAKPSHKDKILTEGLRVVHERGFGGASVRDIVKAAGVPQGSFTNHFASKEAFGLEILDLYFAKSCDLLRTTLRNEALSPLKRLEAFIDVSTEGLIHHGVKNGCLYGNFSAEACEHSELIRNRLVEILDVFRQALVQCLEAAVKAGELPEHVNCEDIASFTMSSFQGAVLLAKAQHSVLPVEQFKKILFSKVLN